MADREDLAAVEPCPFLTRLFGVGLAVVVGDDLSALMLDTPAVVIARDYEDSVHSHTIPTVGATRNLRL